MKRVISLTSTMVKNPERLSQFVPMKVINDDLSNKN